MSFIPLLCTSGLLIAVLQSIAIGAPKAPSPANPRQWNEPSPDEKRVGERSHEFAALYLKRFQRDVTADIIKFADGSGNDNADLRNIALGRLEDPLAEKTLEQLLAPIKEQEEDQLAILSEAEKAHLLKYTKLEGTPDFISRLGSWRIQIALGRIRARDLKGVAKLDAIAQSIGLTWAQVQQFGDQLKDDAQDPEKRELVRGSYQLDIVIEFLDVLRTMGRKGENLTAVGANRLSYYETIDYFLTASHMSRVDEAKFWLEGALAPAKRGFYPRDLISLGEEMKPVLLSSLEKSLAIYRQNPLLFKGLNLVTLRAMFATASATGDTMFLPILEDFSKIEDGRILYDATQEAKALQDGRGTYFVPVRELD